MSTVYKLWSILSPAEKGSAVGLVGLMLITMVLEMLGIGMVVPALTAMSGSGLSSPPPVVQRWLDWLGNPSRNQLVLLGLGLLLGLYAFKAVFLLFAAWRQVNFVARVQDSISRRLFSIYLHQPWTFHLQRNSAELVRNMNDINVLAGTSMSLLATLAEAMVVTGLMALLFWFEPVGALTVGLFMGCATWVLDRLTRQRLATWGKLSHHHANLGYKHLLQGLLGAKDVKVIGCEQEFLDQFMAHRAAYDRMHARQSFVGQLPRVWYELLAVAALCLLTAVMAWRGKATEAMIPTLGLFAAAAFRMLPSVTRLAFAMHSVRFAQAPIETLHAELALERPQPTSSQPVPEPITFARKVSLQQISFRYPDCQVDAVAGVSIDIPQGSSVGLIGGSGAGKSTLVDIILGLLTPKSGRVTVDGVDIATNIRGWQNLIGYVPQTIYLCDDTLRRNVAFGLPDERIDDAAVRRALQAAQLEQFVGELPDGVETLVGEQGVRLSGGQRQRIGIARALYHDPQVLVLDEATSALDTETEKGVMEAVEALHGKKTLIIIAHRLSTVAHCDLLYRLEKGAVEKSGTFAEVMAESAAAAR